MSEPFKRGLFVLVPVVLLFGGAEGALRAAGWPPVEAGPQFAHQKVYWVEPASQHLEVYPHKETGGSFRVSTDANGLRAPLHSEEKPADTLRVMTLGCSTTFGWGVDDEATYPYRLEQILQQSGKKVEVINGGQPGHTSFQGLWLWDRTLAKYKPDVVIWGYIVQDSRKVAYTDRSQALLSQDADFLKQNLLYRSHLYLGVRRMIDGRRVADKEQGDTPRVPKEEYVENLRAFEERTDAIGAKLVLFGFPLEREGYTGDHRAVLHAAADVLDAPLWDPQPEFERYTANETLFFPQDRGHANAAGLDRIAQGMAQFLIAEKIVP
ncbi:MAG: SGNH/GDSL hydrolase family protein [Myxococcota bacterium]